MAQRITRAKKKIKAGQDPLPGPGARGPGTTAVHGAGGRLPRLQRGLPDSAPARRRSATSSPREAIRLGRILRQLLPDVPEVAGLLALMLLIESRRTSRVAGGELVPAGRAGPRRLGPRADRRGPRARARVPRGRPSRAVPDPRRHQRRPHRRPHRRRHRLGPDRHALRAAAGRRPVADRRAQPGRRDRRARRPRGRADRRRQARPGDRTTPGTPPAPTCCAGSAAAPSRREAYDAAIAATENEAERPT